MHHARPSKRAPQGFAEGRILDLKQATPTTVTEALMRFSDTDVVACAMGNIVGLGDAFVKDLKELAGTGNKPERLALEAA